MPSLDVRQIFRIKHLLSKKRISFKVIHECILFLKLPFQINRHRGSAKIPFVKDHRINDTFLKIFNK